MSATIETVKIVKLEDIAASQKTKFSTILDEIVGLGISEYERIEDERTFARDLKEIKREDEIRASVKKVRDDAKSL